MQIFNFYALWKSFAINYDAPGGSAPGAMASPDCDGVVIPVHNCIEISCTGNAEVSLCAPAPSGGRAGARGVAIIMKRGFLQSNF